jgi:Phage gp6-like head-tail connector protein
MPWKPDYLTLAEAKAFLRVTDTVDDAEISGWITTASRAIDGRCNRQFGQLAAPAVRTYRRTPYYDQTTGYWTLEIDDVQDVTAATVNGVAFASAGAVMLPDNAPAEGRPWTRIGFVVWPFPQAPGVPQLNTLSMRWGWTTVPPQVPMAGKLQVSRWNSRRDSPYGIAGSPDQGSEMRLLAKLDPDVATSLRGLSRRRRVG